MSEWVIMCDVTAICVKIKPVFVQILGLYTYTPTSGELVDS